MKQYTEILLSYLRENPVQFTEGTTLLQQLYWCYTECNPLNNEALKTQFAAIYKSMPELSEENFDRIFIQICELQLLEERLSFEAGFKIGLRLAMDLFV